MKYPEKVDFREVLGPNLQIYYCYLVSQMADFTNGGVFSGPKIRHFRELTVLYTLCSILYPLYSMSILYI